MAPKRPAPAIRDRVVDLRRVRAGDLLPNPKNWRQHPAAQRAALRGILAEVGYADALLARETPDGLMLIDGHLRAEETPDAEVPVLVLDLTEDEAAKLLLTLDPLAGMATANNDALSALMASVETGSAALRDMIADLASQAGLPRLVGHTDPDEAPPAPTEPTSKRGDVWLLGDHRLACGDATDAGDVARLMDGAKAAMAFTDPPWNVAIGQDSNPRHRQRAGLQNDDLPAAEFSAFIAAFAATLRSNVTGDSYCVLGASEWPALDRSLRAAGLHWSATIVWVKQAFILGRSKYHSRYEPIWYGWPSTGRSSYVGTHAEDDVWEIDRPFRSPEHPTMKPVALVERAIRNSSEPGGIVLDPFVGSGTTIIAAERQGRRCYAMEISEHYTDVAAIRWQSYSGRVATNAETGQPFGGGPLHAKSG